MNKLFVTSILLSTLINPFVIAQSETYTIEKTSFSTDKYDEFCPVWYGNGLVFCSNKSNNPFINYSDSMNQAKIKMYYIDTVPGISWRKADKFAKEIRTKMNDGPATFSSTGDTIYFSRNQFVEGNVSKLSGPGNKLGLFSAVFNGEDWVGIKGFRYNSDWYNITTPCLSPDGRIYFASDRPGGYGGTDLYYCESINGTWAEPVNLGPMINTDGNESYPFVNGAGELLFSSDGYKGLGGKDILITKQKEKGWYTPRVLEEPVNSSFDDFGIITDALMTEGFISSYRENSIDIYRFISESAPVRFSETQRENQYCFSLSDTGTIKVDTLMLQYEWDFDDGTKMYGSKVQYCFPEAGTYRVNLSIIDRDTRKKFFHKHSYEVEILDHEQPYIDGPAYVVSGEQVVFDGSKSYVPGYDIIDYRWGIEDDTIITGENIHYEYIDNGEKEIKLEVILKSQTTGRITRKAVSKGIRVFRNEDQKTSFLDSRPGISTSYPDIGCHPNVNLSDLYSADAESRQTAVFGVELLSSAHKIDIDSSFFERLPSHYNVREIFDEDKNTYSYVVCEQMSLMATYPSYKELIATGYDDAIVKIFKLKDSARIDLFKLKNRYGLQAETFFDPNGSLWTDAFLLLNQLARLMNNYPEIKIEIGVHTDNIGSASSNLAISQERADKMVDYLVSTGMDRNRLIAIGYGEAQPVAFNYLEEGRRLNRRIAIRIIRN